MTMKPSHSTTGAARQRPRTLEEALGRLRPLVSPAPAVRTNLRPGNPFADPFTRPSENPQIGQIVAGLPFSEDGKRLGLIITRAIAERVVNAWDTYSLVLTADQWHREFRSVMPDAVRYLRRRLKGEAHAPDCLRDVLIGDYELAIEATPRGLQVLMIFAAWDAPLLDDLIRRAVPVLERWQAAVASLSRQEGRSVKTDGGNALAGQEEIRGSNMDDRE